MKAGKFWVFMAVMGLLMFAAMGSSCGGSNSRRPSTVDENGRDSETQAYVDEIIAEGGLTENETLPDSAVNYNTSSTTKSLSKSAATQVTQGETLSPVTLNLGFETDIWNVYVNNTLAASAYSPGVSATDFRPSASGVTITASSSSSAQITFTTSAMSAGSNTIAAAFVPYASKPKQEIGRTTLGTVTVSSQSTTTSGDKTPDTTSKDATPDTDTTTSDDTTPSTDTDTTTGDTYTSTTAGTHALSLTVHQQRTPT